MSIMYNLTRQEAAEKLNISTRSVDRYIKAGKLRAKKEGKVVYINNIDIENLSGNGQKRQEIIVEKPVNKTIKVEEKQISKNTENVSNALGSIYKDLKEEIQKKDELIQTLAMRVGKAEEIAKNSVSLLDFKKSQYLLEESKENINKNLEDIKREKEKIIEDLKYEKKSNIILITFVIILLVAATIIWFMKI